MSVFDITASSRRKPHPTAPACSQGSPGTSRATSGSWCRLQTPYLTPVQAWHCTSHAQKALYLTFLKRKQRKGDLGFDLPPGYHPGCYFQRVLGAAAGYLEGSCRAGQRKQLELGGLGEAVNMLLRAVRRKEINQTSRDNGLKVKEGTSAVGGGKILGSRECWRWGRWLWFSSTEGSKNRLDKSLSGKTYIDLILPCSRSGLKKP